MATVHQTACTDAVLACALVSVDGVNSDVVHLSLQNWEWEQICWHMKQLLQLAWRARPTRHSTAQHPWQAPLRARYRPMPWCSPILVTGTALEDSKVTPEWAAPLKETTRMCSIPCLGKLEKFLAATGCGQPTIFTLLMLGTGTNHQ